VLENVLPPERFKLQHSLGKDDAGRDLICDAVVILDKGKMLPVDSKFSLENYNRLLEEKDKARRDALAKAFKADLKNRIDETAKYIRPSHGTMDYAFMFIPSEAIYYDLLINKVGVTNTSARDLIEYAFRDKNVIIVSPTTFMAYLQTVLQGLRSLQIEEQAKEIQQRVGELGRHIAGYEQYMQKLGGSLGTTVNHFNNAHKELKKIDKDVIKIADTNPAVEPLLLDKPSLEE
jgi:DNA recombination protein RmuC